MATVKAFIRSSKSDKNKPVNVRFRLSDGRLKTGGVQIFRKSELSVFPEKWDEKQQKVKARCLIDEQERKIFDTAVTDRKALIKNIYLSIGKALTSERLDEEIDKALHPENYEIHPEIGTLFQWVVYFIKVAPQRKDKATGRPLAYTIIQQYRATENHLRAFAQSIRRKDFDFSEIDGNFYDRFVSYLQGLGFTQNNVGKHIKVLKTMLNEATVQNINTSNLYKQFHVFAEETDTIYLNEKELKQLKDIDLSEKPSLDRVRDWFLLLAWTGCRFSDLSKITKTDIKDGFITFRQQKTNNKVTIPLHPVVTEILEKYAYHLPTEISNQKFNEYIKEVCRTAEINSAETTTRTEGGQLITTTFEKWEQVSSHTGRRSFCSNMYKRGLPTLMIMSISGHKTEKSFLKYIKVRQEEHAEMMKREWERMYK